VMPVFTRYCVCVTFGWWLPQGFCQGSRKYGFLRSTVVKRVLVFSSHYSYLFARWQSFFLLSQRTPLKRCCVHNMSPFVSSSGLSPGSREAKVQRAKVCLNCTEPSVARSSCWSLPIGRYLSDTRCKSSMVVLSR